jgi:hypothetical protein
MILKAQMLSSSEHIESRQNHMQSYQIYQDQIYQNFCAAKPNSIECIVKPEQQIKQQKVTEEKYIQASSSALNGSEASGEEALLLRLVLLTFGVATPVLQGFNFLAVWASNSPVVLRLVTHFQWLWFSSCTPRGSSCEVRRMAELRPCVW